MIKPGILNGSHMHQQYIRDNNGSKQTNKKTHIAGNFGNSYSNFSQKTKTDLNSNKN